MNGTIALRQFIRQVARHAAWAPLGVLIVHEFGARVFGHEPFIDPTMHLLGGMAMAFFFRLAGSLAGARLGAPTQTVLDLLAFGLTCTVALFWEVGEFAADQYFGTHVQRGLGNTMRDLALGVTGAFAYLGTRRLIGRTSGGAV